MADETDETEVTLSEALRGLGDAILALHDPLVRWQTDIRTDKETVAEVPVTVHVEADRYLEDLDTLVTRLLTLVDVLGTTLRSVPEVPTAAPGPPPYDWERWVQDLGEHATPEARDLAETWWQAVDRLIGAEIGD